jgi:hypothetical protein
VSIMKFWSGLSSVSLAIGVGTLIPLGDGTFVGSDMLPVWTSLLLVGASGVSELFLHRLKN